MPKKILILSSTLGGGHQSAAQALRAIITPAYRGSTIKIVDMSPPLGSAIYRFLSNYLTEIFVKNWKAFNNESAAKLLQALSAPLVIAKLTPLLQQFLPDIIIATHAFSTEAVALTLKQLGLKIPLIVVLVDPFSVHHAWTVYKQADLYLLPNNHCFKLLCARGISRRRLAVTGQPIRPVPQKLSAAGRNSRRFTVFLGGSGEGVGRIDQIVKLLLRYPRRLNRTRLIIACGKNQVLFKQMEKLSKIYPDIIYPYGFTDKIYELIHSSNLVVGKAGPNLMFEAIALGKPILTTGLPLGQEAGNYRFISRSNLGYVTYSPVQTAKKLFRIIQDPALLNRFKPSLKKEQQHLKQTPRRIIGALRPFLQFPKD